MTSQPLEEPGPGTPQGKASSALDMSGAADNFDQLFNGFDHTLNHGISNRSSHWKIFVGFLFLCVLATLIFGITQGRQARTEEEVFPGFSPDFSESSFDFVPTMEARQQ